MADDRRMTFIVVPHAGTRDLSTRTYEISYRTLRRWVITGAVVLTLLVLMAASWFYLLSQTARVALLQNQVEHLRGQVAQTEELRRALEHIEAQKRQIDAILSDGMSRPGDSARVIPPERPDSLSDSTQASLPRSWPLAARGFVTQEPRLRGDGHPGLDVAVSVGTRVLASASGVVEAAGEDPVYGRYVRIAHPGGYETLYGHASRVLVTAHQRVRAHQLIALSGNTGASTAPHLHFEVRRNGSPVDPRILVPSPE
jgi:murein DD-endopeptidase MepM/ murein hydrolase activator NlpD